MPEELPITIIGAGVIGCSVAYELSRQSKKEIYVIEMSNRIPSDNQSGRNSGVIHAGIYYPKDTEPLKARFCVEGNKLLYEFCQQHGISHKRTGKLVVATNTVEKDYLDDLLKTALDNSVPGVKMISGEEAKSMEPNIEAVAALYVPTSGIVDAAGLVQKLYILAENSGKVTFIRNHKVVDIRPKGKKFEMLIKHNAQDISVETEILINAAGLYSDEIARMINPDSPYQMDPVRGEIAKFLKTRRESIYMRGMNVYPVPTGILPNGDKLDAPFEQFKILFEQGKVSRSVGIHLTPTFMFAPDRNLPMILGDIVHIGPAPVGQIGKEDYTPTRDKSYFLDGVKQFFPNLRLEDIELDQTGIRAKLKSHPDFVVEPDLKHNNCTNLVGIDSPGLTSSLAIAKYVADMLWN